MEHDPNGIDQHAPGAKLDAGKVDLELTSRFAHAEWGVGEVSTFGAKKYSRNGWESVEDAKHRYASAMKRHINKYHKAVITGREHKLYAKDSGLHHLKHAAWNMMAWLELVLREEEAAVQENIATESLW